MISRSAAILNRNCDALRVACIHKKLSSYGARFLHLAGVTAMADRIDASGNLHRITIPPSKYFVADFILAAATVCLSTCLAFTSINEQLRPIDQQHPDPTPANIKSIDDFEEEALLPRENLPEYTSAEVAENDGSDDRPIWMSYGGFVYDVTSFIYNHPGGSEKILLAAGSAIEPYWHVYRQHFASDLPIRLLEELIVGRLSPTDQALIDQQLEKTNQESGDPYGHEPIRSSALIVHSDQPMNAEVPAKYLTDSYVTPVDLFFIRHHHPVPLLSHMDAENFELEVDVSSFVHDKAGKFSITMEQIKSMPKVEITTTLQCSGNRRGDMNRHQVTSGTSWGQGAISTAKWGGVRLADILKLAGLDDPYTVANEDPKEKHVCFESLDGMKASIGMDKATNPYGDVIVAYEMNGIPLPRDHGFPLRVIVPGYAAVRNVKWLKTIRLSDSEAEGPWQRGLNYKTLPPNVTNASTVNLDQMPGMTEASVFSGITVLDVFQNEQERRPGGSISVKATGWAWAGGGRNIVRVDLTGNGGKSWSPARIIEGGNQKFGRAWAWIFWECELEAEIQDDGYIQVASKAVDLAFNSQPDNVAHGWNVRGLGNNSWYRLEKKVVN